MLAKVYRMMSMFRAVCLATLLSCIAAAAAEPASPPADPQLNPRGRAILAYFQQLQASPELILLSGQFCSFGPTSRPEAADKIFATTGRWPAMISSDYTDFKGHWLDTKTPNRLLLDYWRAGGLVGLSVHLNNPARPEGGGQRDKIADITTILTPGTELNQRWLHQLDDLAAGLQELQAAGVVVLWRPFHEMNGGWFWWGAQDQAGLIKVWRHMFDYFTKTKGLHNLIWVFSPNHGQRPPASYYPGDGYADLVGLDVYTDDIDPAHVLGYPELAAINKPFGFTEYGPHGASNPPGDFDYRRFPTGLAVNFPRTRFFLAWDDKWNPAENKFAREFYTDPRVITRADLPAGLAGNDSPATVEAWRAERVNRLTKPNSWLTLIGRHPLPPGESTVGADADNTIRLAAGPAHLGKITSVPGGAVTLALADGADARIEDTDARTAELVYHGEKPTHVFSGTINFYVMERGDSLYLRVRDSAADRLKHFAGLDYFPIDPSWRIEAQWVPFDPVRQVNITNVLGQVSPAPVPGKAVFTRDGHTCELLAIDEGAGEPLFFVLSDQTSGQETYAASRFLYAERPRDGKVILDFNRAENPPCAFTPFATCPLPPKENQLAIRITAGEKVYRGEQH